eukprot:747415-Hanusia_phi.AAC.5
MNAQGMIHLTDPTQVESNQRGTEARRIPYSLAFRQRSNHLRFALGRDYCRRLPSAFNLTSFLLPTFAGPASRPQENSPERWLVG